MRTILLDTDIVAYKFAAVSEGLYWFNGTDASPCVVTDFEKAKEESVSYIENLATELRCDQVILALTDRGNEFRRKLYPDYKGNRKGARKPELLFPLIDFLTTRYKSYLRPGLEADDIMGILATHRKLIPGEKLIVSEDKDMRSIPAKLYNPRTGVKAKVTELDADKMFLKQALTGDTTDGYKGCPGIGPKSPFVKAVEDAASTQEAWAAVLEGFASRGLGSDDALLQARLARILRATDYDFKIKAVRLWEPPG